MSDLKVDPKTCAHPPGLRSGIPGDDDHVVCTLCGATLVRVEHVEPPIEVSAPEASPVEVAPVVEKPVEAPPVRKIDRMIEGVPHYDEDDHGGTPHDDLPADLVKG